MTEHLHNLSFSWNIIELDVTKNNKETLNSKKSSTFGSNGNICTNNMNIIETIVLLHIKKTCYSFIALHIK